MMKIFNFQHAKNLRFLSMRKGMLFTAAFVTLSLITLAIALIIINNYQKSQVYFYEVGSMDRLNELSSSIEQGIREIFEVSSGINISLNKDTSTISIKEELPNSYAKIFRDNMANFQDFVESNFPEVRLNLITVKDYLPLIIYPYNMTYTHLNKYGQDRINLIPQQINFNSYDIYVYSQFQKVTGIDWGGSKNGDGFMSITAEDAFGNSYYKSNNVDFEKTVTINVFLWNEVLKKEENILIKIENKDDGKLRIENHASNIVLATTTIDFDLEEEPISIGFPKDTIRVNYTDLGISKITTVKIK